MSRKNRKKDRKNSEKTNLHHPFPVSRNGSKKGTVRIHIDIHRIYHQLFSNLTPDEILEYLISTFWGGYTPKRISTFKEWKNETN